jgi:hypothetical protein
MYKYYSAGNAKSDNVAPAHCMLDMCGYKYTHRLCNNNCFSTTTMVARKDLKLMFYVYCLSVLLIHFDSDLKFLPTLLDTVRHRAPYLNRKKF